MFLQKSRKLLTHSYCVVTKGYTYSVLARNFGKMAFLKHLGKSVRLRAYPRTVGYVKHSLESWVFCLGFFVLKRSLWTLFLGPFPCAKTTCKLH